MVNKIAIVLVLLGATGAQAAGVNDRLPNGQNNMPVYQAPRQTTGSHTTATPNASGDFYRRQFYRQMYRPPRVHRSNRSH